MNLVHGSVMFISPVTTRTDPHGVALFIARVAHACIQDLSKLRLAMGKKIIRTALQKQMRNCGRPWVKNSYVPLFRNKCAALQNIIQQ